MVAMKAVLNITLSDKLGSIMYPKLVCVLFVVGRGSAPLGGRPPSVVLRLVSAVRRPTSAVRRLPFAARCPPSAFFARRPPSFVRRSPFAVRHMQPVARRPPPAAPPFALRPQLAPRCQMSIACCPQLVDVRTHLSAVKFIAVAQAAHRFP